MLNKGKISDKERDELKLLYPAGGIYKFVFPNQKDEIVFTAISQVTANKIAVLKEDAIVNKRPLPVDDINRKIFDECVLWPQLTLVEKETLPIGIIPSVSKIIQEKSGFLNYDIHGRVLAPDYSTSMIRPLPSWGDISEDELKTLQDSTKFSLFRAKIEHMVFIIRPMTRTDIRVSLQSNDDQIALVKSVTLWPENVPWDELPAGWVEALGRVATEISGWEPNVNVEEI